MRGTYLYRPDHPEASENGFVERSKAYATICKTDTVHVISDTMDLTRHMADGRYYDSKSQYRKVTRANNCVEVGNDTAALLKPRQTRMPDAGRRRDDIRRAMWEVRNGHGVRIDKSTGRITGGFE